jgi:hypothetical protein
MPTLSARIAAEVSLVAMRIELDPPQVDTVIRAVEQLLAGRVASSPDPWWQAGLEDALTPGAAPQAREADGGSRPAKPLD